jgi:surfactin synthase thioesterase subunit
LLSSPWLIRQRVPQRRLRLYCFCYAGGNATSYMPWQAALNPAIEVCAIQLPGRGARLGQKPYLSMQALVEDLVRVLALDEPLPYAFFGHSLGALMAFETARQLRRHGMPLPQHMFLSGCAAPQRRCPSQRLHTLSDRDLIQKLKDYNGTPLEILANQELMEMVLPAIRADFSLAEDYVYVPDEPLPVPMTVLTGKLDDRVSLVQAQGWDLETLAGCCVRLFEGDHFFINDEMQSVLDSINAELNEHHCC